MLSAGAECCPGAILFADATTGKLLVTEMHRTVYGASDQQGASGTHLGSAHRGFFCRGAAWGAHSRNAVDRSNQVAGKIRCSAVLPEPR